MYCSINKDNSGNIKSIYDVKGQPSALYADALKQLNDNKKDALTFWLLSRSNSFKNWWAEEGNNDFDDIKAIDNPEPTFAEIQEYMRSEDYRNSISVNGTTLTINQYEALQEIDKAAGLITKGLEGYTDNETGEKVNRVTELVGEYIDKRYNFKKGLTTKTEEEQQQFKDNNLLARTKGIIHHKWLEEIFTLIEEGGLSEADIKALTIIDVKNGKGKAVLSKKGKETYALLRKRVIEATKEEVAKQLSAEGKNSWLDKDDKYFDLDNGKAITVTSKQYGDVYNNEQYNNFFPLMAKGSMLLYNEIQHRAKYHGGNPIIRKEQILYDKENKKAGTSDLMVIYGDGTTDFYDYKFVDFGYTLEETGKTTSYTSKGVKKSFKEKAWVNTKGELAAYKYDMFNKQLGDYGNMVRSITGNNVQLGNIRIIPIGVKRNYVRTDGELDEELSVKGMAFMEMRIEPPNVYGDEQSYGEDPKAYLNQIALDMETSQNEEVNKLLSNLGIELNKLIALNEKYKGVDSDIIERIKNLRDTINNIKLTKDVYFIVKQISELMDYVDNNYSQLGINDILVAKNLVGIYSNIVRVTEALYDEKETVFQKNVIDSLSKEELVDTARIVHSKMQDWLETVDSKLIQLISTETGIDVEKLTEIQKDMGWADYLVSFSQSDNTYILALRKILNEVNTDTTVSVDNLIEEAEAIKKKVETTTSLEEAYSLITNKERGSLIPKWNSIRYRNDDQARFLGDNKHFLDTYMLSDETLFKETYQKRYDREKAKLALFYVGKQELLDKKMEEWERRNDLVNSIEAWKYKHNQKYFTPRNPDLLYSEQYKQILNRPEVIELYNFLTKKNRYYSHLLGIELNGNFIPAIKKDFIDSIIVDGDFKGLLGNAQNTLWDSISIKSEDMNHGYVDTEGIFRPEEYDQTPHIPILYMNNNIEAKDKSYDLLRSTVLFGSMAIRHKNLKKQEELVRGLRAALANHKLVPTAKTGVFGQFLKDKTTGELVLDNENNTATEIFDIYTNYYLYGQRVQSKDTMFTAKVGEDQRVFSTNKILQKLLTFFSVKSLSGNIFSAIPGAINSYMQAMFEGKKSRFYDSKDLWKGIQDLTGKYDKAIWAIEYFRVEEDNWVQKEANNLSVSKLTKFLTLDSLYFAQRLDLLAVHNVTLAMMNAYTIKNGKLLRKSEGDTPLVEMMSEKDGKLHIEGMTPELFSQFRNLAKYAMKSIKGSSSDEDIAPMQVFILGRALMQYRRWITPMVQERFRDVTYNEEIGDVEIGRYRVFWEQFLTGKLQTSLSTLGQLVGDLSLGWTGLLKPMFKDSMANKRWEMFKIENPDHPLLRELRRKMGKAGSKQEADKIEEEMFTKYQLARDGQIRAMVLEARVLVGITLLTLLLAAEWGDDDEDNVWKKKMVKYTERLYDELSFFSNPKSFTSIMKSPLPLISSITTVLNLIQNGSDETLDFMFGQEQTSGRNKGRREREKNDQTPPFHYTRGMLPIIGNLLTEFEELEKKEK